MVEPLFLHSDLTVVPVGAIVELSGSEGKHATSVRRMRVGEAIQLSDGKGRRLRGTVTEVGPAALALRVESNEQEPAPEPKITLVQALAKGDRDELAIQAATELGVWEIIPWQAARSVSRWDQTKAKKGVERWQSICNEAAKQALRSWHPLVAQPVSSGQLVKLFPQFDLVIVLEPGGSEPLAKLVSPTLERVALVVGPEGGIDESELEQFEAAGARIVHLGSEVLRTSTAGVAAISAFLALSGKWSRG